MENCTGVLEKFCKNQEKAVHTKATSGRGIKHHIHYKDICLSKTAKDA